MYPPYGGKPSSYGAPPNPGSRWPPSLPNRPPTDFTNASYGAPPPYGPFPGAPSGPPGMAPPPGLGPPPGMSAPGMAPPGVQQPAISQANRPSGLPANFQPPPNLPNINFNAPVIRLGTTAPSKQAGLDSGPRKSEGPTSGRSGHGPDQSTSQSRSGAHREVTVLIPPTRDEMLRTLFVGDITDGIGGATGMEKLLGAVALLKRWDKVIGADAKECTFGFAQFEDADSLAVAVNVLRDVYVPVKKQIPTDAPRAGTENASRNASSKVSNAEKEDEESTSDVEGKPQDEFPGIAKRKLIITADPSTHSFLESYKESRKDDPALQSKIEAARGALKQAVRDLFYPPVPATKDADGDVAMGDVATSGGETVEIVNIPLAQEDELADIPAEMRETVAAEIAAFRERSHMRDLERLRQEEEFEAAERLRNGLTKPSRLESPPPPSGPRGSVPNAPSGPRGHKGFVNGGTETAFFREDDDTDASDEELWQREVKAKAAEDEKHFMDLERRWVNRERARAAALEREKEREAAENDKERKNRDIMADRFRDWNDEREMSKKSELYYRDRSAWIRERDAFRAREAAQDEADRKAEEAEKAKEEAEREQARGMADSFLEQQALEMQQRDAAAAATPAAPQPFKLKLKMQSAKTGPKRRTVAEVEGLLDAEEDNEAVKRQLVPIKFDSTIISEEDNQEGIRALAQEIPNDAEGLWAWDVQWNHLDEVTIEEKLRPFIEKKIVEFLGVQEQLLVDMVEECLRKKSKPADIVEELGEALDEAEDLVKKVWRMVIFYTECEKRGLSA